MTKQCIHADGHRIWGDVTVSSVLDENDAVDRFLAQIIDITALTEANTRNRALAYHLQELTEKLSAELGSAAAYMSSIMPHSLTGNVSVASCYLPSRELGGDCFDYRWIDDDHLLVYLIDVSGHGLQPALLAVSIHNLLRSGTLSTHTLLSPKQTLTELNNLFRMDSQSNLYFTAWYGIFEHSTRTLPMPAPAHRRHLRSPLAAEDRRSPPNCPPHAHQSGYSPKHPFVEHICRSRRLPAPHLQRRRVRTEQRRSADAHRRLHQPGQPAGRVSEMVTGPTRPPAPGKNTNRHFRRRLLPHPADLQLTQHTTRHCRKPEHNDRPLDHKTEFGSCRGASHRPTQAARGLALNEQLLRLIRGGDTRLVTDLSAVTSIDSSILGALISAWKDARQSGGDLRIVAPSDHVLAVLQRTNSTRYSRSTRPRTRPLLILSEARPRALRAPGHLRRFALVVGRLHGLVVQDGDVDL